MSSRAVPLAIVLWLSPGVALAEPPVRPDAPAAMLAPEDPAASDGSDDSGAAAAGHAPGTRIALGAGGHVAFGSAPAVALGLNASVELAATRWAIGVEGRYDFSAGGHTTQGADVHTTLAGGALVPCMRAHAIWVCGVALFSRVASEGKDAGGVSARDAAFFLGLGGRLVMHVGLPLDFALRVGGEVLAHPIPYELMANGQRLFKSQPVSMSIGPTLVRAF